MFTPVDSLPITSGKVHEFTVYLEDTKRVKEMELEILDLKRRLAESEAKALKFHDSLIQEMTYSMRLKDKLNEYERSIRDWARDCHHK